jgi:hypothetical protein
MAGEWKRYRGGQTTPIWIANLADSSIQAKIPRDNSNDSNPMWIGDSIYFLSDRNWTYEAIVPNVLRSTQIPLPPEAHGAIEYPAHPAAYWVKALAGQDFSGPDRVDPIVFNRALWRGLKANASYPVNRSGADLHHNQQQLLKHARRDDDKGSASGFASH